MTRPSRGTPPARSLTRAAAIVVATLGLAGGVAGPALADDPLPLPLPSLPSLPSSTDPVPPLPSLPAIPHLPGLTATPEPELSPSGPAAPLEALPPAISQDGTTATRPDAHVSEGTPARRRARTPGAEVPAPATELERGAPARRKAESLPTAAQPGKVSPIAVGTGVGLLATGLVALAWPLRRGAEDD